ncbi:hypothetical protein DEU56DRAFT_752531 [Suillus clintonianus]|uniref:uncharacterized protein n=1 Tax=Suillus clintonianus TaxID=1904413 RepID=UPI001B867337|nr:uncharacterized protein DEU56DRAFT_752531 [Suillus clintonianus]KAG2150875.1 hypothetical protein DEU56DRAFT_752531 [Suillus clintonianus]
MIRQLESQKKVYNNPSSPSSRYNDDTSQLLGLLGDSPGPHEFRYLANGQGAPADSQGNYIYNWRGINPECHRPRHEPGDMQDDFKSTRPRSPTPKAPGIAVVQPDLRLENQRPNLKRALSGDSHSGCDSGGDFTKKRRVALSSSTTNTTEGVDPVVENLRLGKEIVSVCREQIAILAHVLDVVLQ